MLIFRMLILCRSLLDKNHSFRAAIQINHLLLIVIGAQLFNSPPKNEKLQQKIYLLQLFSCDQMKFFICALTARINAMAVIGTAYPNCNITPSVFISILKIA